MHAKVLEGMCWIGTHWTPRAVAAHGVTLWKALRVDFAEWLAIVAGLCFAASAVLEQRRWRATGERRHAIAAVTLFAAGVLSVLSAALQHAGS